ncbi:MAG TPA: hypothetical protein VJ732_18440 [Bryobacteraceae bacterium]|nr:hypothetical protein [Bryobacteraceae bacterium]
MRRTLILGLLLPVSLIVLAHAQPDPQTVLWTGIKKQLSGPEGERYFEANLKDTALPPLRGTLVSALLNEGVSRLVLKMPGSEEPDVTLIVHKGSAKLAANPAPGRSITFSGTGAAFSATPFMLTFDVDIGNLQGIAFARLGSKNGPRSE